MNRLLVFMIFLSCQEQKANKEILFCDQNDLKIKIVNHILETSQIMNLFDRVEDDTIVINCDKSLGISNVSNTKLDGKILVFKDEVKEYHIDSLPEYYRDQNQFFLGEEELFEIDSTIYIYSFYFGLQFNYKYSINQHKCSYSILDTFVYDI